MLVEQLGAYVVVVPSVRVYVAALSAYVTRYYFAPRREQVEATILDWFARLEEGFGRCREGS